jgi:hypothetical protein
MLTDNFSEHAGRRYGKFRGKVADNADPHFTGRIQVTVPDVFGPKTIVTADPCLPYGHFYVPPNDTDVWVEFEAGDTHRPVWSGVWYPDGSAPKQAQVSPPEHRVITTAAGHTIDIADKSGEEQILIRHSGGAVISIDHTGKITLGAAKVELGDGAAEPVVLGNGFSQLWTQLLTHAHPGPFPVGPSLELAVPTMQLTAGTHLSTKVVTA